MTGGRFDGRVYISWVEFPVQTIPGKYHLFLHYLDAEGRTQSKPKLVHVTDKARPVSLEPLVLSDGTLLLPIWYQAMAYFGGAGPLDPSEQLAPVYLVRSTDGGESFGPLEKVIDVSPVVWRTRMHRFYGVNNPMIFAVDGNKGSRYRDRVYAVWSDTRAGATTDIWLIRSTDRGHTWSAPVRVNDFAAPLAENGLPDVRMMPSLAVNKDGVLGVTWYDRRDDPQTRRCWHQYFSASLDGGQTFLKNQAISTAASCPRPDKPPAVEIYNDDPAQKLLSWEELRRKSRPIDEARRTDGRYLDEQKEVAAQVKARVRREAGLNVQSRMHVSFDSGRSERVGDYSGLAASTDGSFMAVWVDSRRGNQEMFSARVKVVTAAPRKLGLENRKLNAAVDVIAEEVRFDEAAGLTTMRVKLRNRSDQPIYPPLALKVREVIVGGKDVAVDADSGGGAAGAEWDFSALMGTQNRLDPGMISEPHTVKLRTSAEHGLDVILDYDVAGRMVAN